VQKTCAGPKGGKEYPFCDSVQEEGVLGGKKIRNRLKKEGQSEPVEEK